MKLTLFRCVLLGVFLAVAFSNNTARQVLAGEPDLRSAAQARPDYQALELQLECLIYGTSHR